MEDKGSARRVGEFDRERKQRGKGLLLLSNFMCSKATRDVITEGGKLPFSFNRSRLVFPSMSPSHPPQLCPRVCYGGLLLAVGLIVKLRITTNQRQGAPPHGFHSNPLNATQGPCGNTSLCVSREK